MSDLAKVHQDIYISGVLDGMTRFAWWKDTEEYYTFVISTSNN